MRYLLDTNILLWAVGKAGRLPSRARRILDDESVQVLFSSVSIWEIAIKSALRRSDLRVSARRARSVAIDSGFVEMPLTSDAAFHIADLPMHHRDPFDRILVAQAIESGAVLLTSDRALSLYGRHVLSVG